MVSGNFCPCFKAVANNTSPHPPLPSPPALAQSITQSRMATRGLNNPLMQYDSRKSFSGLMKLAEREEGRGTGILVCNCNRVKSPPRNEKGNLNIFVLMIWHA